MGKTIGIIIGVLLGIVLIVWAVKEYKDYSREYDRKLEEKRKLEKLIDLTRAKTERWADKLDSSTTETGVYIHWESDILPEKDEWGNALQVQYSQGGMAETLKVRSTGPDGISHTEDDIIATRLTANLKGVGEGIKKNIEEVSEKGARGFVKGAIQGFRESRKKKPQPIEDPNTK